MRPLPQDPEGAISGASAVAIIGRLYQQVALPRLQVRARNADAIDLFLLAAIEARTRLHAGSSKYKRKYRALLLSRDARFAEILNFYIGLTYGMRKAPLQYDAAKHERHYEKP